MPSAAEVAVSVVEMVLIFFVAMLVLIPFLGITLWATLASIDVVRRLRQPPERVRLAEADHPALELADEVETLRRELDRLQEADDFHRALFMPDTRAREPARDP
jgi:hypothetical protein